MHVGEKSTSEEKGLDRNLNWYCRGRGEGPGALLFREYSRKKCSPHFCVPKKAGTYPKKKAHLPCVFWGEKKKKEGKLTHLGTTEFAYAPELVEKRVRAFAPFFLRQEGREAEQTRPPPEGRYLKGGGRSRLCGTLGRGKKREKKKWRDDFWGRERGKGNLPVHENGLKVTKKRLACMCSGWKGRKGKFFSLS